jgi:glycosyltransferase involved in cell wall biosynthesis
VLPKLLKTIQEQTFRDYEVIVADAKSTDRTREIAESFGVRVVEGGMPGPGRNLGAAAAKGDILFFADADVELPSPEYLGQVMAEFEQVGADIASCVLHPMSKNVLDRFGHAVYNTYTLLTERVRPHAPGSCIIVRRQAHEHVGGFNERVVFAEDMEYSQRIARAGFRFRMMRSQPINVSVRRLDKDGRWSIAGKYLYSEAYMMLKGPIMDETPFEYEFANFEHDKKH